MISFIQKIRNKSRAKRRPQMLWGYKRKSDGKYLERVRISDTTFLDFEENLSIQDNVFIGHFNFVEASNGLAIEEGVQITNYVTITTHSSHQSIRLYGAKYAGPEMVGYKKGAVKIGKYSFIGPHSTIMPETTIGKGSVVAAYSYVKGVFPDFAIIAGNPAKVVGDSREMDKKVLANHPELKEHYSAWSGENVD